MNTISKIIFLIVLQIAGSRANAQNITVCIDATHAGKKNSISILKLDPLTGFDQKLIQEEVEKGEKKVIRQSFTGPATLMFNNTTQILAGENDSLFIAYRNEDNEPFIAGGRYPGNYQIYQQAVRIIMPAGAYKKDADNYSEYIKMVDSVSFARKSLVDAAYKNGTISKDVFEYMQSFIQYAHISSSLINSSASLKDRFPQTGSQFIPFLSLSAYNSDHFAENMMYILSGNKLVRYLVAQQSGDIKEQVPVTARCIEYVLTHLSGETRARLIYSLVINNNFGMNAAEKTAFSNIYPKLAAAGLPPAFLKSIQTHYLISQTQGCSIEAAAIKGTSLRMLNGSTVSLQSVLDKHKGEKILLAFWASWCGPCISGLPKLKAMREKDPALNILHFSLDTNIQNWKQKSDKLGITANQYLVNQDFNSPLAVYFQLSGIPRYVLVDADGIVTRSDLMLHD